MPLTFEFLDCPVNYADQPIILFSDSEVDTDEERSLNLIDQAHPYTSNLVKKGVCTVQGWKSESYE